MSNQYEPTVKATIAFLKLLNVKVNKETVNETLQNHPDWPSLLCVGDSLNKWHIPNGAGRIDTRNIEDLPTPFIAYTHSRETPLSIITGVTETTVNVLKKEYNKIISENKEAFLKNWDGVYLIAEPNEKSGEVNFEATKRDSFIHSLIPIAAFTAIIGFFILFLNRVIDMSAISTAVNEIGVYIQFSILLIGVITTSLLLWYEIDRNNPLLQKVCSGITKGDCNAILTSKESKLFSWLSWSEVGFFYFTGGLLTLLFADNVVNNSMVLLLGINILALPYTIFSVYYQWRVAKQWCVLCLVVQGLLILGVANLILGDFFSYPPNLSLLFIVKVSLSYLLPAFVWYSLKPYILNLQEAKNTKREYLRIKFNAEIYETLLKKQKKITVSTEGVGIDIGNPLAQNTLIKVCNPYCGPCAKAHPVIDSLLENNSNLKVKIIFTSSNINDFMATPVKHLLSIAEKQNESLTKQALDDWYLPEKKDYEEFVKKHPLSTSLDTQNNKMVEMKAWCDQTDIAVTPTFFVNGYQLPDAYNIQDLQYFLME